MNTAVIWDVEFLAEAGSPQRFWCGPSDPDPVLVQIGAVKLSLSGDFALADRFIRFVIPRKRDGARWPISPFFADLTGITENQITEGGEELGPALAALSDFAAGAPIWAWGNDELFAVAISCYLAGITAPLPPTQFHNATRLLLKAGIPEDEIKKLRSNTLAGYFGIAQEGASAHDALSDATSTALALQHLLRTGRLTANDFNPAGSAPA